MKIRYTSTSSKSPVSASMPVLLRGVTYLAVQLTTSTCSLKIISQPLQRETAQSSLLVVIAERSIFGHQLKRFKTGEARRGSHGDSSAAGGFGSAVDGSAFVSCVGVPKWSPSWPNASNMSRNMPTTSFQLPHESMDFHELHRFRQLLKIFCHFPNL